MLRRAPATVTEHTGGVGLVHNQRGAVFVGEFFQRGQIGDVAFHAEDTVGDDQLDLRLRLFEHALQLLKVAVFVNVALGFGQPDGIDD